MSEHGALRHPDELRHHECLVYSMTAKGATWPYRVDGQLQAFAVRGRIQANNGLALVQAAAQGMGITLQPDFIAEPFLQSGQVVTLLQNFEAPPLGIYAVLPSNRYIPHRVNVLIEHLSDFLADG
jgi:DNA-binding transcriptional LysR family regulator